MFKPGKLEAVKINIRIAKDAYNLARIRQTFLFGQNFKHVCNNVLTKRVDITFSTRPQW